MCVAYGEEERKKTDDLKERFPLDDGTSEMGRSGICQRPARCSEALEQQNGEDLKRIIRRNGVSKEVRYCPRHQGSWPHYQFTCLNSDGGV